MKTQIGKIVFLLCVETMRNICEGQGFIDLDFESANVSPLPAGQFENVLPANAFPGWQVFYGAQPASSVVHNGYSVGSVSSSILGPNYNSLASIIEGNYTAVLVAGVRLGFGTTNASLSQVGQVPLAAQSLRFKVGAGNVNFLAMLGGQTLSLIPLESTAGFDLYGADISGFAGQVGELRITSLTTPERFYNPVFLDSIEFSSQAVPEPGTWALLGLGGALLWWGARRRRK